MPEFVVVWLGTRPVRAELTLTAATEEEARALAAQVPAEQLSFWPVATAPVSAARVVSVAAAGAGEATALTTGPTAEQLMEAMEQETWRPALG